VERLASAKEDLGVQLCNKDAELADAKNEVGRPNSVLERYRTQHIRSAEVLRSVVLELLAQCNLLTPKIGTREGLICGPDLVTNPAQRRKISSEDSAEILAVGSLLPFGKGTVCADFTGSHGNVARAEGTNGWISIRIWSLN
jgi:hypothetical protein